VTIGPGLGAQSFSAPSSVHLCASAPHSEILRQASIAITHAGDGTVMRALAAGVPLVCMPMGRDQNDNAARVVARGAGLRRSAKSSPRTIARSVTKLLEDTSYRENAERLATVIQATAGPARAVAAIEALATSSEKDGHAA
jgi:UDP:flavonoid glycosyltransferase YjiC (YdhE family)